MVDATGGTKTRDSKLSFSSQLEMDKHKKPNSEEINFDDREALAKIFAEVTKGEKIPNWTAPVENSQSIDDLMATFHEEVLQAQKTIRKAKELTPTDRAVLDETQKRIFDRLVEKQNSGTPEEAVDASENDGNPTPEQINAALEVLSVDERRQDVFKKYQLSRDQQNPLSLDEKDAVDEMARRMGWQPIFKKLQ